MRLPLATDLMTRDGLVTHDAKVLNGFIDSENVFKRPAANSVLATTTGLAQGGINNNALVYIINADVIHSYNSAFTLQQTIVL